MVAATSAGTGTPVNETGMTDEDGMIYHQSQTSLDPSLEFPCIVNYNYSVVHALPYPI